MRRFILSFLIFLWAPAGFAQVQSDSDVTFAVPDGWTYKPGADFGSLTYSSGQNLWFLRCLRPCPPAAIPRPTLKQRGRALFWPARIIRGCRPCPTTISITRWFIRVGAPTAV